MVSRTYAATLIGLNCQIIEAEVDYRHGLASFAIVGLPDKSVQEAKERISSALRNSTAEYVPKRIVVNLAPAELHKTGAAYDLAIAVGFLLSTEQVSFDPGRKLFLGELALDGSLRPINGVLPIVYGAKQLGFQEVYLPWDNMKEAELVGEIKLWPVRNLNQLIAHLRNTDQLPEFTSDPKPEPHSKHSGFDLAYVQGQLHARRALEIAAAGGHNLLLSGVPGSGKTMLSRCLPGIMPAMTLAESMETTQLYSIAGLLTKEQPLIQMRPFRSPHHTSSHVALVGGGTTPRPGEISLAHRGVLFLDEFPEFSNSALEALRQPLEDRIVTISRAASTVTFPANFMLVAAMNPCRCGYLGDPDRQCICTALELSKYRKRISGPIMDRIDLAVQVNRISNSELSDNVRAESSELVAARVLSARQRQTQRLSQLGLHTNSEMLTKDLKQFVLLDPDSTALLDIATKKLQLSARAYFRVLKVARTIADLTDREHVIKSDIAEALSYRLNSG